MSVTVKLPTQLRAAAGGESAVVVEGSATNAVRVPSVPTARARS